MPKEWWPRLLFLVFVNFIFIVFVLDFNLCLFKIYIHHIRWIYLCEIGRTNAKQFLKYFLTECLKYAYRWWTEQHFFYKWIKNSNLFPIYHINSELWREPITVLTHLIYFRILTIDYRGFGDSSPLSKKIIFNYKHKSNN